MQKWMPFLASCLLVVSLGCGIKSTDPTNGTGTLRILLTDAPAAFEAVSVTFSEVSAHINNRWIVLNDQTQKINLLEWNNGKTLILGQADVEVGQYTQIRLKIDDAEVTLDGQTYPLFVPSGVQSGLKLLANFEIVAGSTYDLVLDFDAERSVVNTGTSGDPNDYILKPTVRVAAMALTGSISGTVTNPTDLPVAYALVGTDTVTSTPVDGDTGFFRLAFLPPDDYTVSISDTTNKSFSKSDVTVTVGQDNSLGQVTLQ